MSNAQNLERSIGLWGTSFTVIGLVIGISIFLLLGALGSQAGTSVVVPHGIACLPGLVSCRIPARIGALFPAGSASFESVSRVLSPGFGFMSAWMTNVGLMALAFPGFRSRWRWPLAGFRSGKPLRQKSNRAQQRRSIRKDDLYVQPF